LEISPKFGILIITLFSGVGLLMPKYDTDSLDQEHVVI
jgi:hypothetical protein